MWVKGHSGVNETADRMVRESGWVRGESEIATTAGIKQAFPIYAKPAHMKCDREALFIILKEPSIAFSLSTLWRWTAASRLPRCLSQLQGPLPSSSIYNDIYIVIHTRYCTNLATATHHSSSLLACSLDLPTPPPTHGHRYKCAEFCGAHPSQIQLGSSTFPISFSHCRCGPVSVTR